MLGDVGDGGARLPAPAQPEPQRGRRHQRRRRGGGGGGGRGGVCGAGVAEVLLVAEIILAEARVQGAVVRRLVTSVKHHAVGDS